MDKKSTAWQIETRMLSKGLKRNELAEKIGIDKRKLYLSMSNRNEFSLELLVKVSEFFECSIEDLLKEIPQEYKK